MKNVGTALVNLTVSVAYCPDDDVGVTVIGDLTGRRYGAAEPPIGLIALGCPGGSGVEADR